MNASRKELAAATVILVATAAMFVAGVVASARTGEDRWRDAASLLFASWVAFMVAAYAPRKKDGAGRVAGGSGGGSRV